MDLQLLLPPRGAVARDWPRQDSPPDLARFAADVRLERKYVGVLYPRRDEAAAAFLTDLGRRRPVESETRVYVDFEDEQDQQLIQIAVASDFTSAMSRLEARITDAIDDDGGLAQRMVKANFLPTVTGWASGRDNIYLSQNTFGGWRRDAASCAGLTSLWVDLDYYKISCLAQLDDDADAIDSILGVAGLLPPSQIVRSGRGLYVRWIFNHYLPAGAAPRWRAVQQALLARFKCFGADPAAQDVARVFRIVGSRNTKSGGLVRVIHSGPAIQFDDAARLMLPVDRLPQMERELVKAQKKLFERLRPRKNNFAAIRVAELVDDSLVEFWATGCITDIEALIALRGGRMDGYREKACFFSLNFQMRLGQIGNQAEFDEALRRVSGRMHGAEFSILRGKVMNLFMTRVRYRISRSRLIEDLGIAADELIQLPMIGLKARRAAKIVPLTREPKRPHAKSRADKELALELHKSGIGKTEIAMRLGISKRSVQLWFARLGDCTITAQVKNPP